MDTHPDVCAPHPPAPVAPDHPRGTTVLILGVLSLTGLAVLGPVAWAMGRRALREAAAAPHPPANLSALQTGTRLGRWGTCLLVATAGLVILAVLVVLGMEALPRAGAPT